ncbi:MAG: hypothetical protein ABFD69_02425 [Candidatus Sumerlaeia bacterium]
MVALAPWLLFIGLLFIPQNRLRGAWLILIPLALCQAVALLIPSRQGEMIGAMLMIGAGNIAVWWLVASARPTGFLPYLGRALAGFCVVVVSVNLSFFGGWAREANFFLLYGGIGFGAPLISALIAGRQFRRNPTVPRLMISSGLYMFGLFLVFLTCAIFIDAIFEPGTRRNLGRILPQILLIGSLMALILNGLFQPFMILAASSPFWRERMRRVFRIPDEPAPADVPADPATERLPAEKE